MSLLSWSQSTWLRPYVKCGRIQGRLCMIALRQRRQLHPHRRLVVPLYLEM
jgi:hypothetical protein